jgi:hypothetical protein
MKIKRLVTNAVLTSASFLLLISVSAETLPLCVVKYANYEHVNTIDSETSLVGEVIKIQLEVKSNLKTCDLKHAVWFLPGSRRQIEIKVSNQSHENKKETYSVTVLSQSYFSPKTVTLSAHDIKSNVDLIVEITSSFNQLKIIESDAVFFVWLPPISVDGPRAVTHLLKVKRDLRGHAYHLGMETNNKQQDGIYDVYKSSATNRYADKNNCDINKNEFEKISCNQMFSTRAIGWTSYENYAEIAKIYRARVENSMGKKIEKSTSINFGDVPNSISLNQENTIRDVVANEVLEVRKLLRYQDAENVDGLLLQVRPIENIVASKIGVCREYTTLLISKLLEKNIESHPVLVNIRDNQMWIPSAPLPAFDHVLVYIPSLDIYVDPTDVSLSPLSMYQAMIGRVGLNAVTGEITRIHLGTHQIPNMKMPG